MKASFVSLMLFLNALTMAHAGEPADIEKDYGSRPSWDVVARRIQTHALVGFEWVDQPLVGIALIQLPDHFCAVKFLYVHTGRDDSQGGMFRSSGVSQYAEIAMIELPWPPTQEMLRNAKPKQFQLSWRPLIGIGRMTFQRGHDDIKCGNTAIPWGYPSGIFESVSRHGDIQGLRVAPTVWRSFADINLADPRLHWFSYDESREKILAIPISELPGWVAEMPPSGAAIHP